MPTASGRLQERGLNASDRSVAMWMHLSVLLAFLVIGPFAGIAPLVLWLARRGTSHFDDDHGREVVNMSITGLILFGVVAVTAGLGMILLVPWAIVALIGIIRGAIAANNGEYFRYPMTIRFIQQLSTIRSAVSEHSASELNDVASELKAVGAELKAAGAELKADLIDR